MAEEIITSTNAETATDHEYNASEIQDVYKRQVQGNADQAGLADVGVLLQRGALDEALLRDQDVYKRQA